MQGTLDSVSASTSILVSSMTLPQVSSVWTSTFRWRGQVTVLPVAVSSNEGYVFVPALSCFHSGLDNHGERNEMLNCELYNI